MKKKTTPTVKPKTPKTKKRYIESHWLIFGIQGIIAIVSGWFILFTEIADPSYLILLVGSVLLTIGVIELSNTIFRRRHQHAWGLALAIAIIEIAVATTLLLTANLSVAIHLSIIASYTITRGVFDTLIGLRSLTDTTDRFLWIITGIFGMVLGFVILNSGHLGIANTAFIDFFGTYLMVFGLANLVFSIHNKAALASKN